MTRPEHPRQTAALRGAPSRPRFPHYNLHVYRADDQPGHAADRGRRGWDRTPRAPLVATRLPPSARRTSVEFAAMAVRRAPRDEVSYVTRRFLAT